MQILPPKWATRDSNSTLEMAPRTPIVCKGLRSSSNLKRKDAPLTLIISFIEKEKKNNILRYKSPTPAPLPSYLSQVAIKFSQWCLKKTRRFEVCKNLNQYVKKKRITKVYRTKQKLCWFFEVIILYVPDAVNLFCQWAESRVWKKKFRENRMLIHARGALFFIMTNLAFSFTLYSFVFLYFLLYFEVWDLLNLKCSY